MFVHLAAFLKRRRPTRTSGLNGLFRSEKPTRDVWRISGRSAKEVCSLNLFILLILLRTVSAHAIIFYSTGDPAYNTTAPTGDLAGSGWQYQGHWGSFLGTPIAPQYFITAGHIGGTVGDQFTLDGIDYTTTATFVDSDSDLRIWRIAGRFPFFAPLYADTNEVGKALVVFGRGTQRGLPVEVPGPVGSEMKGWFRGAFDSVQRWGENRVDSVVDGDALDPISGGSTTKIGELLEVGFDQDGGSNEADLSAGDSGGGVLIKDGPTWKLAGINYGVAGPYSTTNTGQGFQAAIFDESGLYQGGEGKWVLTPHLPTSQPGAFLATRISAHLNWINNVLALPIPTDDPVLQSAGNIAGPFADDTTAVINSEKRTIMVPRTADSQFYRLRSTAKRRVTTIQVEGGSLVLTYE